MSRSKAIRLARADDLVALAIQLPSWSVRWGGWVWPSEGPVTAIGAICWDRQGWAVCFFNASERPPAIVMHRLATRAVTWLRTTDAHRILTAPDNTKPLAAEWLRRLGFHETATAIPGFDTVLWECDTLK